MKAAPLFLLAAAAAFAQAPGAAPVKWGGLTFTGNLRTRVEMWDWMEGDANNSYAFSGSTLRAGFGQQRKKLDWLLEFEAPVLLGLPDDAIAPGNQGQLGLGGTYFASNDFRRNAAMLFVKQAFVVWKGESQSLKAGRMEFIDGTEVIPKDATLAALKRDRIAHRLLGNFGFTHVGRSYDGLHYRAGAKGLQFTFFGGRPTRGVFQTDGWGEVNANVLYGALTGTVGLKKGAAEWRVFNLFYNDLRDVLKVDDRPLSLRRADTGDIKVNTVGGHYLHTLPTRAGSFDLLLWGALQFGVWGAQDHRAGSYAAEAGWQPPFAKRLKPWLRGGYNFASGDKTPLDSKHGTFFQVLPTPRIYARFPFYNLMNSRQAFGQVILRPAKALTIRADVHSLSLASAADLWYLGGGAFQPWTFGFQGRASNGNSSLATLYDLGAEITANPHVSFGAYYGHAAGGDVMRSIYPRNKNGSFGYVEATYRF